MSNNSAKGLSSGVQTIQETVKKLPGSPGVYRMLNEHGDVLYIGKAKSLKKRVASYTNPNKLSIRIQRMVAQTTHMEVVETHTEVEALLLESNLIKKLKPRYNILLRDDKSFPYILITDDHDFPQVTKHRGQKKRKGSYFGPFATARYVNQTIQILQRAFLLRNCSDNVFSSRKRPCLQYHIKRCTAPCVGYVDKQEYAAQVDEAREFLDGENTKIQKRMADNMQQASDAQDYEKAALYRDRIRALSSIQAHQDINMQGIRDADVIAIHREDNKSCIQVFFFRGGRNFGNASYFPRHDSDQPSDEIVSAFLAQFYENKPIPKEIIIGTDIIDKELMIQAFSTRAGHDVHFIHPQRGKKKRLLEFAAQNAKQALNRKITENASHSKMLQKTAALFDMQDPPKRIEVYDNSHISGTNMVGAMIVTDTEGFKKSAYRKFNIKTAGQADDYGMMREVIERRFKRLIKDSKEASPEMIDEEWPDLLLIDGGKGQFNAVSAVLEDLGVQDDVTLVAIAKGPDRNAGREKFFMHDRPDFSLPENDPTLHFLQRLRDEAHRYAIGAHRTRREKQLKSSPLDAIEGVGATRKKALLLHFGSAKAVAEAGVMDLARVEGVSKALAQKIYDHFH